MRKVESLCISIWIALVVPVFGFSQNIQWADRVLEVSSEATPLEFAATQALGEPNVFPNGGENPNAWMPGSNDKQEHIKVGFSSPITIQQIAVAETYNPSALTHIYAYEPDGTKHLITRFEPEHYEMTSRLFNFFFSPTSYKVRAIELKFDGEAVVGKFGIDAIAISDSPIPIRVGINVSDNLREGLRAERMSNRINSPYREVKPWLAPNGQKLYFTREVHPDNTGGIEDGGDIWFAEKDSEGDWKEARKLSGPFNTPGTNALNSMTQIDTIITTVILTNRYGNGGKMKPGASISQKIGGEWLVPRELQIIAGSKFNKTTFREKANYHLHDNGKFLLLAIDNDDSFGNKDLYVSFLMESGYWSEPLNLGPKINTAFDEMSPFLAPDGETLYFSTNGYSGHGKSDIFFTKRLDGSWSNWSEPENLGPDVNSEADDLHFSKPVNHKYAYYTKIYENGDADIFRLELPLFEELEKTVKLKLYVHDATTNSRLSESLFNVSITPDSESRRLDEETIEYTLFVDKEYDFKITAKNYRPFNFEILPSPQQDVVEKNIYLKPKEEKIEIENILFAFGTSKILPDSSRPLDVIAELLKSDSTILVEISTHTDSIGTAEMNMQLSRERALSVSSYLLSKGVPRDRLRLKWYGEALPIASNKTEEGRRLNRRVEFKIIRK